MWSRVGWSNFMPDFVVYFVDCTTSFCQKPFLYIMFDSCPSNSAWKTPRSWSKFWNLLNVKLTYMTWWRFGSFISRRLLVMVTQMYSKLVQNTSPSSNPCRKYHLTHLLSNLQVDNYLKSIEEVENWCLRMESITKTDKEITSNRI